MGRDLNELEPRLKLGMRQESVIKALGAPSVITDSVDELDPYLVSPPKGEKVMLYSEYPWGILVYVSQMHRVSRLILVRAP